MQWFIIGRDMHVLCTPSTDLLKALPIDDSSSDLGQEISIVNNCAVGTYDFKTDPRHKDSVYIVPGNYVAFRDKYGKDRLYTIMTVEGDEELNVHCEDIGIDLINEYAVPWDYTARSIADTLSGVLFDSGWEIGINEVATYKRATKFEGTTDSQLTRIGDVCNQFDCECDFVIEMKGAKVTKQVINIYKSIGEDKTQQRFIDNVNLISLSRSGSIEDLITCVRCYGKEDENGNKLTIADIEYDDGRYYSPKGNIRIFDREAHQKWSRFRAWDYQGQGEFDGYINGTFEYDTEDAQELFNRGLSYLKENNDVKLSYEASISDLKSDIGDTVQIADNRFQEKVYLSARIQSVKNHYTVVGEDTGTLANYTILVSKPATAVQEAIDKLKDQIVSVKSTDIAYQIGESGVEPPTGQWVPNPPQTSPGQYLWTRKITTYTNNSQTTEYSVSRNGDDGKDGEDGKDGKDGTSVTILGSYNSEEELIQNHPTGNLGDSYIVTGDLYVWNGSVWENVGQIQGPQGIPGSSGTDGKTSYIHVKYSNDGGKTFTANAGETPGDWFGQYTDFTINDSNNPSDYKWSKTKGDPGEKGEQGEQGKPGTNGSDGISIYLSNESMALGCDYEGNPLDYSQATGTAYLYKGADDISTSASWSATWSGMNGTFSSSTRVYKVTSMTADIGTLTIKAVYQGTTFTKIFTVTKALKDLKVNSLSAISAVLGKVETGEITNKVNGKNAVALKENAVEFYDYTNIGEFCGRIRGSKRTSDGIGKTIRFELETALETVAKTPDGDYADLFYAYQDGFGLSIPLYYFGRNMGRVFGNLPDDTNGQISNINSGLSYSASERVTTATWFGKQIYKKTIHVGSTSPGTKTISHGISNADTIWIDISNSFLIAQNGSTYLIPRVVGAEGKAEQQVACRIDKSNLYIDSGDDATFSDCYVTVNYTKTS